uniref:Retrotransposon gag domain-containing protein n=1 Tax=Leptobrachium leishanense TaxID=445787 RepID=A0A8C5PY04_9ANUR
MEPVEVTEAVQALTLQVTGLTRTIQELHAEQQQLRDQFHAMGPPPPYDPGDDLVAPQPIAETTSEPQVPLPDRFFGDRSKFETFVLDCHVLFSLKPQTYNSEFIRVRAVISLLGGEPKRWAHTLLRQNDPSLDTWASFSRALESMYRDPHQRDTAQTVIKNLKQGRRPVEEYITEFRHFSHQTGWNDTALLDQFRLGLADHLKDELARVGIPPNMEALNDFCILVDRRMRERRQERGATIPWIPRPISNLSEQPSASTALVPVSNPGSSVEPMQIGLVNGRLPRAEVDRRRQLHLCLYCAEASHQVRNCPIRNGSRRGKPIPHVIHAIHTSKNPSPLLLLPILLQWQQKTIPLQAMVDS